MLGVVHQTVPLQHDGPGRPEGGGSGHQSAVSRDGSQRGAPRDQQGGQGEGEDGQVH